MLKVTLLGTIQLRLAGQSLSESITGKRLALLIYLMMNHQPQEREVLADLLWCDVSSRQARKNLRDILPALRKLLGEYLIITRRTIGFNRKHPYWLDAEVFGSHVTKNKVISDPMMLREMLNLYQGDFLAGFYVRKAPVFEEWALLQRELLQKQAVDGLYFLANHYLAQGEVANGLAMTQRLLRLEPWHEQAHRLQMMLLVYSGQRSAALAQYITCQRVLAEEYGAEPLAETTILYEQIKLGQYNPRERIPFNTITTSHRPQRLNGWLPNTETFHAAASQSPATVNWDAIPTPPQLYGRQSELDTLEKWLMVDRCQLVGLFALGGQGKTALVAEFVHQLADSAAETSKVASALPRVQSKTKYANAKDPMPFECILWYSLVSRPTLSELLDYFLQWLLPSESLKPITLTQQLETLVACLRRQRCLLVLDHVDKIMSGDVRIRADYELYGELWRWVGESQHISSLIVISREEVELLIRLERDHPSVRCLPLSGLSVESGVKMLRSLGQPDQDDLLATLVELYSGHPLALRVINQTSQELQLDDLEFFLETLIFDDLRHLLDEHFSRLSAIEREIVIWLAMEQDPSDLARLWHKLAPSHSKAAYFSAQRSLRRRSLLTFEQGKIVLPNIVLAYTREHLIETNIIEPVTSQTTRSASQQAGPLKNS